MARLVNGAALNTTSFIEQWTKLAGVSSLLACAQRTGSRIGIWGGCVRNFVLDDRPISEGDRALHFIDFVDPYSDVDCVIDRADDWPLIIQSVSASVAFAGYHRWECQTLDDALSTAGNYARIGAESIIVWHEGFDEKKRAKITIQPLEGRPDALLAAPITPVGIRNQPKQVIHEDPWQEIFDAMRLSRYFLQYPREPHAEGHTYFPERKRLQHLMETPEAEEERQQNWLRFDLGLLDLLMTAQFVPAAVDYVRELAGILPASLLERSGIFNTIRNRYAPTLAFLGGLVYRQRNKPGLQLRLLTQSEENLARGGFKSIVPWTLIWSLGTGGDDCCRHEDFRNGIAVASWRSLNPNVTYSQAQAFELAPAALITRDTPYGVRQKREGASAGKLLSIPGIVRVGAGLTLRFDHAYMAQLLGRNLQISVGAVNPETFV